MNKLKNFKTTLNILLIAMLFGGLAVMTGCDQNNTPGDELEEAGESLGDAAEEAGESAQDAVEEAGDEIEDAADNLD